MLLPVARKTNKNYGARMLVYDNLKLSDRRDHEKHISRIRAQRSRILPRRRHRQALPPMSRLQTLVSLLLLGAVPNVLGQTTATNESEIAPVTHMDAGSFHTVVIIKDAGVNVVKAWGANGKGQVRAHQPDMDFLAANSG